MALDEAEARPEETLEGSDFVDFRVAGTVAAGEFRCSECGYGAIVHRELPPCPMCGGTVWEKAPGDRLRRPRGF